MPARLASILPVHFFHKAAHGSDERGQFPPFGDGVCGVEGMLARIGVTFRRARRCSAVHPAAAVRHRGLAARRTGPRPRPAAWAQVHGQSASCLSMTLRLGRHIFLVRS